MNKQEIYKYLTKKILNMRLQNIKQFIIWLKTDDLVSMIKEHGNEI